MRKMWMCAAAVVGCVMSSGAMAQPYVAAGLGADHVGLPCTYDDPFPDSSSCDRTSLAGKVLAGYEFASGFGFELGYVGGLEDDDSTLEESYRAQMVMLNGAYRVPITKRANLRLRLGVAGVRTKHTVVDFFGSAPTITEKGHNVSPYAGLGLTVTTFSFVDVEVGADFARAELGDSKATYRALTVGARFRF